MDLNLLNPEIQQFINANIDKNIAKLALQKNPFPNVEWIAILNQIEAKTKSKPSKIIITNQLSSVHNTFPQMVQH